MRPAALVTACAVQLLAGRVATRLRLALRRRSALDMTQLLLVALGGAAGACARFWLSGAIARRVGETFPWGTLAVNATGALAIGVLAALLLRNDGVAGSSRDLWLALVVGVLGSYTTVSSFSLQTLALARGGECGRAVLNVLASLALCLGAAIAGHHGGARLFGG